MVLPCVSFRACDITIEPSLGILPILMYEKVHLETVVFIKQNHTQIYFSMSVYFGFFLDYKLLKAVFTVLILGLNSNIFQPLVTYTKIQNDSTTARMHVCQLHT